MMIEDGFSIDDLKARFSYEPLSGKVHSSKSGKVVGGRDGGYLAVWVSSTKKIRAHRLAWALHYGEWPTNEIDHINGNGRDNRIDNLRIADRTIQAQNVALSKNNKVGIVGVCPCKQTGKYKATINVGGKQIWLGRYSTVGRAAAARKSAEMKLGWQSRGKIWSVRG